MEHPYWCRRRRWLFRAARLGMFVGVRIESTLLMMQRVNCPLGDEIASLTDESCGENEYKVRFLKPLGETADLSFPLHLRGAADLIARPLPFNPK